MKLCPLGNCINLCNGFFNDATEMAQFVDNAVFLRKENDKEVYRNGDILIKYSTQADIHTFFGIIE